MAARSAQAKSRKRAQPSGAVSEEAAFLRKYRPADFPRPSVTVDVVAFTVIDAELRVLLVQRGKHPFKGAWAVPGGFVRVGDGHREQEEETSLSPSNVLLEQVAAFGQANRDPRMRVISIAFCALIRPDLVPLVRAGGDANEAHWFSVTRLHRELLAFDHAEIVERTRAHVAARVDASDIASSLVPATFTIQELRHVHALLSGKPQDPGNFRRKFARLLEDGIIERATGKRLTASKPALVYRFAARAVARAG